MPKNGRFFYGSDDGIVKELVFNEFSKSVFKLFMTETKSITKVEHSSKSLLSIIPFFLADKLVVT